MKKEGKPTNAIYYRKDKFREQKEGLSVRYLDQETQKDASRGYLGKLLRHLETGITFYVFTTHLKAKIGFEEVRSLETRALLDAMDLEVGTYPTILTGDFNDVPDSKALQ